MQNLDYLVAAYVVIWVILFAYIYSLSRRQKALKKDIELLRKAFEEKKEGEATDEERGG